MKRSKVVGLAVLCSVCILLGNRTAGDPPPDVITVPHTEVVHEPGPEKTIYIIPKLNEHCRIAIRSAHSAVNHAGNLYDNGETQLDIFAHARQLLAAVKSTTVVDEEQRALLAREVGDLAKMQDALTVIGTELKICNRETK